MAYGLRVWNSSGKLTLDVSDRLFRLHSTINITMTITYNTSTWQYEGDVSGTVNVPGMSTDGTWYIVSEYSGFEGYPKLRLTLKDGKFDWSIYDAVVGTQVVQVYVFRV